MQNNENDPIIEDHQLVKEMVNLQYSQMKTVEEDGVVIIPPTSSIASVQAIGRVLRGCPLDPVVIEMNESSNPDYKLDAILEQHMEDKVLFISPEATLSNTCKDSRLVQLILDAFDYEAIPQQRPLSPWEQPINDRKLKTKKSVTRKANKVAAISRRKNRKKK